MANLGHSTVTVVGQAIDHYRHTAGPVSLVANLRVAVTVRGTRAAFDGPLNRVFGHVARQRLIHCQTQARISRRVRVTHAGSNCDLADQLGKELSRFLSCAPLRC